MIKTPYLLFLGDAPDALAAKVAQGVRDWRPDYATGQIRLDGCKADLGLPDMDLDAARAAGAQTLVIGVANRGGVFSDTWKACLIEALGKGFDLAAGLHTLLRDDPDIRDAAEANGRALHDVRLPRHTHPIAAGTKRAGKRCLAVGTDCSVGKMYTTMAIEHAMQAQGHRATFRATGQTGILITGEGVPLDAVVADFMAGAIEWLTPENDPDHWDIIEGQGSLYHVSYSGVSLALIHGGQPDALILCDEPTRDHMRGLPDYKLPSLEDLRDLSLTMARIANPACQVAGISVNTAGFDDAAARDHCRKVEDRMGLPTVDPYRHGAERLADAIVAL